MAGLAIVAVTTSVHVVRAVAAAAGSRSFNIVFIRMATGAIHARMLSCQGKAIVGKMVEVPLRPINWSVATGAILAERATMLIILLMTCITLLWGISPGCSSYMAVFASAVLVFTQQLEIAELVIKSCSIQCHDGCAAAEMFRMTACALCRACLLVHAVKASCILLVGSNFGVAISTQCILALARKRFMTGSTIRLKLCMTLDYLAWHDQLFYIHCISRSAAYQLKQGKRGKFPQEIGQFVEHHSIHMHRQHMHAG